MKNNIRNSLVLLVVVALFIARSFFYPSTASAAIIMKFSDVNKQSSSYSSILYVTSMDYMNVYKDAQFKPKNAVTKADAAKFVGKASEVNTEENLKVESSFDDITEKTASYSYIVALANINAFSKSSKFTPDKTITRQEAAKLFVNAFNLPMKTGKEFDDVTDKNSYSEYISTAASYNILNGNASKDFRPTKKMNRADFAVALKKAIDMTDQINETILEENDDLDSPDSDLDETN